MRIDYLFICAVFFSVSLYAWDRESWEKKAQDGIQKTNIELTSAIDNLAKAEGVVPSARWRASLLATTLDIKQQIYAKYVSSDQLDNEEFRSYVLQLLEKKNISAAELIHLDVLYKKSLEKNLGIKNTPE